MCSCRFTGTLLVCDLYGDAKKAILAPIFKSKSAFLGQHAWGSHRSLLFREGSSHSLNRQSETERQLTYPANENSWKITKEIPTTAQHSRG